MCVCRNEVGVASLDMGPISGARMGFEEVCVSLSRAPSPAVVVAVVEEVEEGGIVMAIVAMATRSPTLV
jgi:hypothetical protein